MSEAEQKELARLDLEISLHASLAAEARKKRRAILARVRMRKNIPQTA